MYDWFKLVDSLIDPNQKLITEYSNLERYRRLIGTLIYLTRPNFSISQCKIFVLIIEMLSFIF